MLTNDWVPDSETIRWVAGILHEDRILDTVREEVTRRAEERFDIPDEVWRLLVSVAVEHVTFDIARQAQAWGADLSG